MYSFYSIINTLKISRVIIASVVPDVTYKLKEISTNKWYNLAEDIEIEVKWDETTETKVEDELKKSQIKVIK